MPHHSAAPSGLSSYVHEKARRGVNASGFLRDETPCVSRFSRYTLDFRKWFSSKTATGLEGARSLAMHIQSAKVADIVTSKTVHFVLASILFRLNQYRNSVLPFLTSNIWVEARLTA